MAAGFCPHILLKTLFGFLEFTKYVIFKYCMCFHVILNN